MPLLPLSPPYNIEKHFFTLFICKPDRSVQNFGIRESCSPESCSPESCSRVSCCPRKVAPWKLLAVKICLRASCFAGDTVSLECRTLAARRHLLTECTRSPERKWDQLLEMKLSLLRKLNVDRRMQRRSDPPAPGLASLSKPGAGEGVPAPLDPTIYRSQNVRSKKAFLRFFKADLLLDNAERLFLTLYFDSDK